jgi:hypothetical protein
VLTRVRCLFLHKCQAQLTLALLTTTVNRMRSMIILLEKLTDGRGSMTILFGTIAPRRANVREVVGIKGDPH